MSFTAYVLKEEIKARPPTRWEFHARCAIRLPDQEIVLPVGTWLLALSKAEGFADHYRLANGTVVCIDEPLTYEQADTLTDEQALQALNAYRPLEEIVADDHGLLLHEVSSDAPFQIIECPLCGSTEFTTITFSSVWCNNCNCRFDVRYTAGDPGFVVDCTWEHMVFSQSRYLMPRTLDHQLTMVCKNGGDLLNVTHRANACYGECTPEKVAVTLGEDGTIRTGLHACALGDVYDWSFYGSTPNVYAYNRHGNHEVVWPGKDNESWPKTAFVPVSGLSYEEKSSLTYAASLIRQNAPEGASRDRTIAALRELVERPSHPPANHKSTWPKRKCLAEGEKYLLHHWLISQEPGNVPTAVPVWIVVKDVSENRYSYKWEVVRDDICPKCGERVTAGDMKVTMTPKSPWTVSHGFCRKLWVEQNWEPTLFVDVEQEELTPA